MKRMILWGLALALASSPALSRDRRPGEGEGHANPSAVIAEEIAFARLAQEKGQWTAFRTTARASFNTGTAGRFTGVYAQ